jgi:hypothetical protein
MQAASKTWGWPQPTHREKLRSSLRRLQRKTFSQNLKDFEVDSSSVKPSNENTAQVTNWSSFSETPESWPWETENNVYCFEVVKYLVTCYVAIEKRYEKTGQGQE